MCLRKALLGDIGERKLCLLDENVIDKVISTRKTHEEQPLKNEWRVSSTVISSYIVLVIV